jgi:hypothetical protein
MTENCISYNPDDDSPVEPEWETLVGLMAYKLMRDNQMIRHQMACKEEKALLYMNFAHSILQSEGLLFVDMAEDDED